MFRSTAANSDSLPFVGSLWRLARDLLGIGRERNARVAGSEILSSNLRNSEALAL